ncbi:MAG TPA: YbhB/YbcL family Raf kinase inhibitor-like protein [Vicinamibacterales bacterium]|jgi:Raf kinase inhibitor-like YbhB/YbcL family protein|nr:YbhB/YbcL family Raf kinase inhibitor-like protein [Vicinamibacterales bacterium]
MYYVRSASSLALALAVSAGVASAQTAPARGGSSSAPAMTLTSTAFADGTVIPDKYTQAGDQTSPALTWTNTPPGTVSFVLHMHDPDVARNHSTEDQLHWLVWNIPATTTSLPEGVPAGATRPDGSHQLSASGPSYRGPGAPASGPLHHYTFEIYALDTTIDVQPGSDGFATRKAVLEAMQGHVLGKAVYVGLFHRPQ